MYWSSAALRGACSKPDDAAGCRKAGDTVTIWHQSGKGAQQTVEQAYADEGQPQHKVTEFIDDMAAAYAWADVVVCRSGALTVSEIAAAGLPALFVPFQHKDRQQYWNALPLEKAGAAKILNSHNLPPTRSPPPWRAGTETHCWRWRNAHARPLSLMRRNGWQRSEPGSPGLTLAARVALHEF